MDLDLLADYLNEGYPSAPGHLLSNLPDRLTFNAGLSNLAHDDAAASSSQRIFDPNQAGAVISKIEDIFESIADCILGEKKELSIQLKSRTKKAPKENEIGTVKRRPKGDIRSITFPSKSPQEAWKFTALLRILELSHEALVSGVVTTKRDIYYRDPELFMKQAVVDRYVDDIAFTLGVERDALNVVAAAKGLVAGYFIVTRKDGSTVDCSLEPEGILIPNVKEIESVEFLDVQWILVIEKEATFRTLATTQYWRDSLAGKGVIVTAKGYPDIQTRQFLHLLSIIHRFIPVLALVDYDPDGLGITSTYKHNSLNLAHETNLAVPSIHWLGIRSTDFMHPGEENDIQGLLQLSARDRRIARKMLEKEEVFGEEGREVEWRREVQVMLMLSVKAEIQVLGSGEKLKRWLDGKLIDTVR